MYTGLVGSEFTQAMPSYYCVDVTMDTKVVGGGGDNTSAGRCMQFQVALRLAG